MIHRYAVRSDTPGTPPGTWTLEALDEDANSLFLVVRGTREVVLAAFTTHLAELGASGAPQGSAGSGE